MQQPGQHRKGADRQGRRDEVRQTKPAGHLSDEAGDQTEAGADERSECHRLACRPAVRSRDPSRHDGQQA
jgi:hypothetical protein